MNEIKMIVTDLDKTLLRSDGEVSAYTCSVLRRCRKKGMMIVFATARPARATTCLQNDVPVDCVIANNGATVVEQGKVIYNNAFSEELKQQLIHRLCNEASVTAVTVEAGNCIYVSENQKSGIWYDRANWNPIFTDFLHPISENVPKISAECEDAKALFQILKEFPEVYGHSHSGELWHQIMLRDSSKWNAIRFLSERKEISMKQIIAFGDDQNDLEMLKNCGVGVAVRNAVPEVKEAAGFVTETNDEDGVAKFLEQHLL